MKQQLKSVQCTVNLIWLKCNDPKLVLKQNVLDIRFTLLILFPDFPRHACFYLPMIHNFLRQLPDQQVSVSWFTKLTDCKIMKTIYSETCNFRLKMAGGWMQVIMPAHTEYKILEHRQMGRNKTSSNPNLKVKDGPEDRTSWHPHGPSPWACTLSGPYQ